MYRSLKILEILHLSKREEEKKKSLKMHRSTTSAVHHLKAPIVSHIHSILSSWLYQICNEQ